LRIGEEGEKKWQPGENRLAVLCFVMAAQAS